MPSHLKRDYIARIPKLAFKERTRTWGTGIPSNPVVSSPVMGNRRVSDRERARLRGPVRTCVDYCGDETESMSEAEYGPDGRLLMWRGRISGGARIERVYSYNSRR